MGKSVNDKPLSARIDIRLTQEDKETLERIAKKARRTVTSYFQEWIDILKRDEK